MVVLLPKVKVDYYTAWIVWARCQRVLGSLPWCLHEGAPALRMEGCITMSPAVTLHSLLSLSGRFKVLNIIFPREDDLFLSLWSSLPTLPSILKIARLSGTQPQVLQLLFLLCGRKNLQFGGGGGGRGQDAHLPEREGHIPQSSSPSHNPALRLHLLNGEAAWRLPQTSCLTTLGKTATVDERKPAVLFLLRCCFVIFRLDLDFKDPCISWHG